MKIGPSSAPSSGASLRGLALRDPLATTGAAFLVMLILISAIGPLLPIGDPTEIGIGPRLSAPAAGWPLGTDELGRSNLPRLVEGINATFLLASTAVLLTAVIGILAGMAAGYAGGLVDIIVMRFADILFSFRRCCWRSSSPRCSGRAGARRSSPSWP